MRLAGLSSLSISSAMSNSRISSHAELKDSAAIFAALGDETRLLLISKICDMPQSISRLTQGSTLSRQAITKHLRVLEGVGVVRGARVGRENVFKLVPEPMQNAQTYLQRVSVQWDHALARLKFFAEK